MQCDLAIPQVTQIQRKHMSIQKLYMITHSSFICNYQKLKLVQMSIRAKCKNKWWYIYTTVKTSDIQPHLTPDRQEKQKAGQQKQD